MAEGASKRQGWYGLSLLGGFLLLCLGHVQPEVSTASQPHPFHRGVLILLLCFFCSFYFFCSDFHCAVPPQSP